MSLLAAGCKIGRQIVLCNSIISLHKDASVGVRVMKVHVRGKLWVFFLLSVREDATIIPASMFLFSV